MIAFDLSGVDKIKKAIEKVEDNLVEGVADELKASSLKIASDAKRKAPVNLGTLRQSITTQASGLTAETFSTSSYAPYVEFGTGGKVNIPAGYENEAALYKNKKGGKFVDFLKAIKLWVKRKGIPEKAAYPIAKSILEKGISPQPFMIPSYEEEKPKLLKRLKKLFS